jgi:hypothetical protein
MKRPEPIKEKFNTEVKRTAQEIEIRKRGAEITKKAITHFDKYQSSWINNRYGALINSVAAPGPQLTPDGQKKSASQVATEIAINGVNAKQNRRLEIIQEKVERMVSRSKGNDPTRPRERDNGLGR